MLYIAAIPVRVVFAAMPARRAAIKKLQILNIYINLHNINIKNNNQHPEPPCKCRCSLHTNMY